MNQPDRQDLFVVPEGQQKITYKDDPKVPNARQYKVCSFLSLFNEIMKRICSIVLYLKNPFPCVEGMLPSCLALVGEGNVSYVGGQSQSHSPCPPSPPPCTIQPPFFRRAFFSSRIIPGFAGRSHSRQSDSYVFAP